MGPDGIDRRQREDLDAYIDTRIERILSTVLTAHREEMGKILASGFPDGDPVKHKAIHDEELELMRSRRKMYDSIKEKTITGLIWLALIGVGTALLEYAKKTLNN